MLITNYDRRELLAETLRSILDAVDFPVEVLVGNANLNRPIDGRYTGISSPEVLYINHPHQYDTWENYRVMLRQSTGRYVTSISDDDLFHPQFFASFKAALTHRKEFVCLYTSYTSSESEFRSIRSTGDELSVYSGDEFFAKLVRQEVRVMGNCGCFSREFLETVDGFPQWDTCYYPDTFQALYLASCTDTVLFVDQPLVFYRDHAGSTSSFSRPMSVLVESQDEFLGKTAALIGKQYPQHRSEYLRLLLSRLVIPMYWQWKFVRHNDVSCPSSTFREAVLRPHVRTMSTGDKIRVEAANGLAAAKYMLKRALAGSQWLHRRSSAAL